jgi:inactivated superfamily I helicase
MDFIKTYRKYLIAAASIWAAYFVLFLLIYIFALRPQKETRHRIENWLIEKKQIHESALKASQNETRIRLNEQITRLRDRLKDFVIDYEDAANLTFDISKIADDKNVDSLSIKSNDKTKVTEIPNCNYIGESHIDIDFIAGFNQFAAFLNALERNRPVLFVDEFTITNSRQIESGYRVNLKVAVYVKKPQADKTTASGSG